jgi:hypothetical protein
MWRVLLRPSVASLSLLAAGAVGAAPSLNLRDRITAASPHSADYG